MANSPNYAEIWQSDLLKITEQEALATPFFVPNVKWLGGKTFHFSNLVTSGYKNHSRSGGFNAGSWEQNDVPYTVGMDRDVEFFVDKADVDETNYSATIERVANSFQVLEAVPEFDARFFSRLADAAENGVYYNGVQKAEAVSGLVSKTKLSEYSNSALAKLKAMIKKIRKYRPSLIGYVSSDIMDKLSLTTELTRTVETVIIPDGGVGIETRYTAIDGVPIFEVWDENRFYNAFDFAPNNQVDYDGFRPKEAVYKVTKDVNPIQNKEYWVKDGNGDWVLRDAYAESGWGGIQHYEITEPAAVKLNAVFTSLQTTVAVKKIASLYFFAPGQHTKGDGYLAQIREYYDTFVLPNGKNGKVDSVAVDLLKPEA